MGNDDSGWSDSWSILGEPSVTTCRHWIFFINIPVGIFCAFAAMRLLNQQKPANRQTEKLIKGIAIGALDWALQLMLDLNMNVTWFNSPVIVIWLNGCGWFD